MPGELIRTGLAPDPETGESRVVDVTKFLSEARNRFQFGLDVDQIDRMEAEDDNCFANSSDFEKSQWDQASLRSRRDNHRPIMQWNRIPVNVAKVVNDGRQNKPSIKISQSDGGTKETAEFYQSRIRHIEYDCDADVAYDTAREQQITSGRGFIRVNTEWIPGTFQQKVCIDRIENQFSVVYDPSSKRYDRSDAEWCFVISRISKEEHERRYGKETTVAQTDFTALWMEYPAWVGVGKDADMIQICEYWVKEYKKRTLLSLANGQPIWKDEFEKSGRPLSQLLKEHDGTPWSRQEQDAKIKRYVINGVDILEEGDWVGSTIPIVPVWGREAVVQGIRRTYSLIRMAKDPQRGLNLLVSNLMEQLAMMPKAPYEAPIGSIAPNHEADWRDAGSGPKAVLYYKEWDENGRQLTRPSRVVAEPPIEAIVIGMQNHIDAIKAAMGIFDASLGARSNETSGVAIERRKQSAEIVNFHFADNESRSRKRIGEILLEIIPKIDKSGSTVPTRTEDGKTILVPLGQPYTDPKTGQEVVHNLGEGVYAPIVSTGPSYQSQRQEINERDQELIKAWPELMMVIGDLYFATDDAPGADERAERMKNFIQQKNPGIIQDKSEQKPLPPEVQQQIVGMQQELAQTQAFAQSLHEKLETKQPELNNAVKLKQMDIDFQTKKLAVDNTTKVAVEEIKLGITSDLELLHHEIDVLKLQIGVNAEKQAQEADQQHQAQMADKAHAQALEQGDQAQAGELEQQDQAHQGALEQQEQAAALAPKPEKK